MTQRVTSLFSGIGGFEAGFQGLDVAPVLMCEIDPAAAAVLGEHFPDVEIARDVTQLKSLPECEVVVGGWPCQDLSQAGRTAGITGVQSSLVGEVFRLIDAGGKKPQIVLLENVAFALSLHKGEAIKQVVKAFEDRGYSWAYRVLDSREFGLPQRRRRVFICASLNTDPWAVLCDGPAGSQPDESAPSHFGFYWTEGNRGLGWTANAVPPLKGGSSLSIPSPPAIWDRSDGLFWVPTIEDAERLQGFEPKWTSPAAAVTGSDRARWRLVGNAVSVPVARWIGKRLCEQAPMVANRPTVDSKAGRSATAGWGAPGQHSTYISGYQEGPVAPERRSLVEFGKLSLNELSLRAAGGFLGRYERSKLSKNAEFVAALRAYCA